MIASALYIYTCLLMLMTAVIRFSLAPLSISLDVYAYSDWVSFELYLGFGWY